MKVSRAIAKMLGQEGVDRLIAYPVNPVVEACAEEDIRTVIVRQERTGLHMADAAGRLSSGGRVGVFAMQHGPGVENSFGGVAQAYSESVPMVVIPAGYPRARTNVQPNFSSLVNFQNVTKSVEQVTLAQEVPNAIRRAFTQAKNGRPGPCMVEVPWDLFNEEFPGELDYRPSIRTLSAPDPAAVRETARILVEAELPVIYAGQGVHYGKAWRELRELAELLEAPVTTSIEGKSSFPETHPLSLQSGGRAYSAELDAFLSKADVVFGIGASFTQTTFGIPWPKYLGRATVVQATIDTADLHKDVPIDLGLVGDSGLTLAALLREVRQRIAKPRGRAAAVTAEISAIHTAWRSRWSAKLDCPDAPINPYRVIRDLAATVDIKKTIITHDAGSPRDQLTPFWQSVEPLSYIGWGKTTQLGYGLGLAMGAKLEHPDKLCINWWGDAAIGFTGMDFETAVRERIPILSVLSNNFSMAIEIPVMQVATEKFRGTDISGNYAEFANALGGYGERITDPDEIVPAIRRGIAKTEQGVPTLLEFITSKELEISKF
ncbi:MAG: thiamine pyrophosphate-requiring protein [Bryobacterales bacterium]|nr:thiamine pyrophosphate-requiring protein [Bryobacterales bacterium]